MSKKGGDTRSASEKQLERDLLGLGVDIPVYTPRRELNPETAPKPSKKQGRGTRSDIDVAGPSVPQTPLTRKQANLQSPTGTPRRLTFDPTKVPPQVPMSPVTVSFRAQAKSKISKAQARSELAITKAEISQLGRELGGKKKDISEKKATISGISSSIYKQKYPKITPKSDTWKVAQYAAIAHHIPSNVRDAFEAKLDAMYRSSKMSGDPYSIKAVDNLVMAALENSKRVQLIGSADAPDLEAASEATELEEGEIQEEEEDDPRTSAAPLVKPEEVDITSPPTTPTTPTTPMMVDLEEPSVLEATDLDLTAAKDDGIASDEDNIPQDRTEMERQRQRERDLSEELPLSLVEQHREKSPTPSIEVIELPEGLGWDYHENPDHGDEIATAESVGTMELATPHEGESNPDFVPRDELGNASLYGGSAGSRVEMEDILPPVPEVRNVANRARYMQNVYRFKRPTFLRTANKQAVSYSNNPVKQSMSLNFGSLLTRDRTIQLRNGSIIASRRSAVIKCSKKTRADVHVITGFLRTEFPYGANVGGSKYALVGLIPKVLRSLPGTVKITT